MIYDGLIFRCFCCFFAFLACSGCGRYTHTVAAVSNIIFVGGLEIHAVCSASCPARLFRWCLMILNYFCRLAYVYLVLLTL